MNTKEENDFPQDYFMVESLFHSFTSKKHRSPFIASLLSEHFVADDKERVIFDVTIQYLDKKSRHSFERAGPRQHLFWHCKNLKVALVACGGLAPGLNNVIQNVVTFLENRYKVKNIVGVPFGLHGFQHNTKNKKFTFDWIKLNSKIVQNIDTEGGCILGSGRGHSSPTAIVDALEHQKVDILFLIGGDGTLAAAHEIHQEVRKRKRKISVVGIPKTIDNDIPWVSKTFGFGTAVSKAMEALRCARNEACGAYHGIGLVRLMGRNSGAITATAAMTMNSLDFVLIPEVPLYLEGEKGFLNVLAKRLTKKGHITIALAEGSGQHLFPPSPSQFDASGNKKLKDIGQFLRQSIEIEFAKRKIEHTVKYINPSYMLRAQTTTAEDSIFCTNLSQNAVHAAMCGKTGCYIGYIHEKFVHIPLQAIMTRKRLDLNGTLWRSVLAATGQPSQWK